jgi:hypothetical protein
MGKKRTRHPAASGSGNHADWRSITDEKERYAAYLCSRDWAVKREAVRDRAKGTCEVCEILPMAACHHLNYSRKYNEELTDLQAICQACHDFTHGKSSLDPSSLDYCWKQFLRLLCNAKSTGALPPPSEWVCRLANLMPSLENRMKAMRILCAADLEQEAVILSETFPFVMGSPTIIDNLPFAPDMVDAMYQLAKCDGDAASKFLCNEPD